MNEKQFVETYCYKCGTQRCEGIGTEWFEGCPKRWNLDGWGDPAAEIEKLQKQVLNLSMKIVRLNDTKEQETELHGEWINIDRTEMYTEAECSECRYKIISGRRGINALYCPHCGAKMDGKKPEENKVVDKSRCHKCVNEMHCPKYKDKEGKCLDYRRDAPDGGYYR